MTTEQMTTEQATAAAEIRTIEDRIELLHMQQMASGQDTHPERAALEARQSDLYGMFPHPEDVWI